MTQVASAWLILFLPLAAFLLIPLVPEKKRTLGGWLACAGMFCAFALTAKIAWPIFAGQPFHSFHASIEWILIPNLQLEFGVLIDSLSVLMLLVVTGVGSVIFYYSLEYMAHDEGYRRYFAGLSLFAFSMIGIVVSINLLELFIFWELVGFSSYLLIGHWYKKMKRRTPERKRF